MVRRPERHPVTFVRVEADINEDETTITSEEFCQQRTTYHCEEAVVKKLADRSLVPESQEVADMHMMLECRG